MNPAAPIPAVLPVAVPAVEVAHTAGVLLLVVGVIFGLAWLARRLQELRPAAAGVLRVQGGLQVGARERVLWIKAGDTHLLIGVAPGRVQTLHVFEQPPAGEGASGPGPAAPNFGELMRRALGRGGPS